MRVTDTRRRILTAAAALTREKLLFDRGELAERAGVTLGQAKDHLNRMVDSGEVVRKKAGVYFVPAELLPVEVPEDRPISVTVLTDLRSKVECGDQFLDLSHGELRMLKAALGAA